MFGTYYMFVKGTPLVNLEMIGQANHLFIQMQCSDIGCV